MTVAEIIGQVLDAGGQISVDGADLVLTAPRPLAPDLLDSLKVHKAGILEALARPDPPAISPEFAARLSAEDLADLAAGDLTLETVQAFEQAAIAREARDLTAILEHDAGLPRPDAELEAARITATYARNKGYTWASLREAVASYPALLAQLPDTPGPIDSLAFGTATVHVGKGAKPGPVSSSITITEAELDAARKGRMR